MSAAEVSFEAFYKKIGFSEYPFAKFSAEQEGERRADLFIRPIYYGPVDEAFRSGQGMFVVGERGTGKTAAIYDFLRVADASSLVVSIDDFSEVPIEYKPHDLYFLIISRTADAVFKRIFAKEDVLRKLTPSQRLLLSYIYKEFTTATTKGELRQRLEQIQYGRVRRWGAKFYNWVRHPLNFGATAAINFAGEAVAKALGNISPDVSEARVKDIFPGIPLKSDESWQDLNASLRLLTQLGQLSKDLGLGQLLIVLDKLDEEARLEGDAEKIKNFVKGVVTETGLYLSGDVQFVASIWSVPFKMLLRDNVRTQKMSVHELRWEDDDLVRALDKRIEVFSEGKLTSFRSEIAGDDVGDALWNSILNLANGNPRDLWHLVDHMLRSQFALAPGSEKLSARAVELGRRNFVSKFNYFEYYPRKASARSNSMDVYAYIRHLLRLASPEFTRNQLTERSGVSGSAANNYVSAMENMGLISSVGQTSGNVNYIIRDPKIKFALENTIDISLS